MDFITEKKGVYTITPEGLDLVNSFIQLHTVSFAILFGLLAMLIVLSIFKS